MCNMFIALKPATEVMRTYKLAFIGLLAAHLEDIITTR